MLLRLAYLGLTNTFALLRLCPVSDRDKDREILALRHQIGVLQRQLGGRRARFAPADRALLAALLHRLPRPTLRSVDTLFVELSIGLDQLAVRAACRVVYVANEPRRNGFAHGTLPGHPKRGETAVRTRMARRRCVLHGPRPSPAHQRTSQARRPLGRRIQDTVTDRYPHTLESE